MLIFGYNLVPFGSGIFWGCGYNLCFAVEPPRRGFFSGKMCISPNFGHVHFPKKCFFVKNLISGS